ncbi:SprT family protein [Bacillus sp. UMB0893]|uniref:SprT family protein n=1 Tax=Bacillus sp. UMB0893 TaxID=2066053 RepID=UPI000C770F2E|nr:SprT family protein [Bacillus sp. UMB0893]PLR65875.1 SprT family protein [Bacillus sp. UMB0893]
MNEAQLQELVESISITHFNKKFLHKASFNNRLRTTGGRYLLRTSNIEINPKYLAEGLEEVVGIIKHELCHYHLHIEGRGYKHGDPEFKELLAKVKAPRFCKPLQTAARTKKTIEYQCSSCLLLYKRYKRMNINKYVCGKCGGKIKLIS